MPETKKGKRVKSAMKRQYGAKKGEQVFYASANKGTITGVHAAKKKSHAKKAAAKSRGRRVGRNPSPGTPRRVGRYTPKKGKK